MRTFLTVIFLFGFLNISEAADVTPPEADLGVVPYGTVKKITAYIKNTAASPITVKRIEATCDCMKVEAKVKELQPGEEMIFTVCLFSAKLSPGRFKKLIFISTFEPKLTIFPFILKGIIEEKTSEKK